MKKSLNNPLHKRQGKDTEIKPNFDLESLNNPETFQDEVKGLTKEAEKENLDEILKQLRVDPTEHLEPPQTAWIQEKGEAKATLGTLGNFSLIIGKAKSRKSFFINIAVSAVLNKDILLDQFRGCLPPEQNKVLYFDTEQGKYHVQLLLKRICKQINEPIPENLTVYYLRSKSPSERLELVERAIYNTPNLGFVVIDGIKDLITSINDEAEATMISSKLLKWTEEKNIHIITVLHQNKSDNNARGHIGTELINKAETTLSVTKEEKDKNISTVEAQYCRWKEPLPFSFEIDPDGFGLPVIAENVEIRTQSEKRGFDITEIPDEDMFQILKNIFKDGKGLMYSDLVVSTKEAYKNSFGQKLGDNKIKELISYCKIKDMLKQPVERKHYYLGEFQEVEW